MLTNNGTEKAKGNGMGWAMGAVAIGAVAMAMGGQATQAAFTSGLVDFQFRGTNTVSPNPLGPLATGAAATGSAGDVWNYVSRPINSPPQTLSLNLVDGTTSSGATVTPLPGNAAPFNNMYYVANTSPVDDALLSGGMYFYFHNTSSSPSYSVNAAEIGGLDSAVTYNLYLYEGTSTQDVKNTFTVVGATSPSPQTLFSSGSYSTPAATGFQAGVNYAEFTLRPNGSGNITVAVSNDVIYPNSAQLGLSGFQLQAVPEPAALGLLAVGGAGLLLLKRRRTA